MDIGIDFQSGVYGFSLWRNVGRLTSQTIHFHALVEWYPVVLLAPLYPPEPTAEGLRNGTRRAF